MELVHGKYIVRTTVLVGFQGKAGQWVGHWEIYDPAMGPGDTAIGAGDGSPAATFELAGTLAFAEAVAFTEQLERRGHVTVYRAFD